MGNGCESVVEMSKLITNISELHTQNAAGEVIHDAAVAFEGELITWVGRAAEVDAGLLEALGMLDEPGGHETVDAGGRAVLPGWVDSHTHLIFDGDRSAEFEARMAGENYSAGGINLTTSATRAASDERLVELLASRVREAVSGGTTFIETKTGYGLSVEEEIRHARLAARARDAGMVDVVTFLGAHLVPEGVDADAYIDDVTGPMLDGVRDYVDYADVFCERGAFDEDQSRKVLQAAAESGLGLRVHGNQLGPGSGVQLAVELGATSVDHVNYLSDEDVSALADSWSGWDAEKRTGLVGTVATCLPACDLSTRQPLAPGRELLDAGVEIALASNCNPGTSYTTSMNFCVATAVLQMRLSLAEAIRAATFGGALALGVADRVGSIEIGKRADLHMLTGAAAIELAYRPGMNHTYAVWRAGQRMGLGQV